MLCFRVQRAQRTDLDATKPDENLETRSATNFRIPSIMSVLPGSEAQKGRESWLFFFFFFRVLWNIGSFLFLNILWLTALSTSLRPICSHCVWKVSCQKMYCPLRFCVCKLIFHLGKESRYFSQREYLSCLATCSAILVRSIPL